MYFNSLSLFQKDVIRKALNKAIGGGIPGAIAGVIQVLTLMWLVEFINFTYQKPAIHIVIMCGGIMYTYYHPQTFHQLQP